MEDSGSGWMVHNRDSLLKKTRLAPACAVKLARRRFELLISPVIRCRRLPTCVFSNLPQNVLFQSSANMVHTWGRACAQLDLHWLPSPKFSPIRSRFSPSGWFRVKGTHLGTDRFKFVFLAQNQLVGPHEVHWRQFWPSWGHSTVYLDPGWVLGHLGSPIFQTIKRTHLFWFYCPY